MLLNPPPGGGRGVIILDRSRQMHPVLYPLRTRHVIMLRESILFSLPGGGLNAYFGRRHYAIWRDQSVNVYFVSFFNFFCIGWYLPRGSSRQRHRQYPYLSINQKGWAGCVGWGERRKRGCHRFPGVEEGGAGEAEHFPEVVDWTRLAYVRWTLRRE